MAQPTVGEIAHAEAVARLVGRIERLPFTGLQIRARVIIGTATFFDAFDALSLSYILPALVPLWKIGSVEIGTLIAVGYIGQLVGAIIFGWIAEKWGRMPSLMISVAIFAVFSALCALSTSYWMLFAFRTIQGVGLGGEVPVAAAYINEISKAKGRGLFFMAYEMLFNIGLLVVALTGRILVPTVGWQGMFLIGAIPAIVILFMRLALPESPRWLANKGRLDEAERIVETMEAEASKRGTRELPPVEVKPAAIIKPTRLGELFEGIYRKRTVTLWLLWFTAYFATYGMQTWAPSLYSTVFKLSLEESLTYPLYAQFAGMVGFILCILLIDRVGRKPWFMMAYFFGGLPLVVLWMTGATSAAQVATLAAVSQFFFASLAGGLYLYAPENYPTRLRALGGSVGTAWLRIASAIGPYTMGWLLPVSGIAGGFLTFGLVLLVGFVVVAQLGIETKGRILEEVSP